SSPAFVCPSPSLAPVSPLSLHDALPISDAHRCSSPWRAPRPPPGAPLRGGPFRPWSSVGRRAVPEPGVLRAGGGRVRRRPRPRRSEEHTSELQSRFDLVCRLLLEKKTQ